MTFILEELDYQKTPLGDISLRRRSEPRLNDEILYEVKLGDEFLMSSLFTEAEIQLSKLGISALKKAGYQQGLDIVVGGLGLGYTADAALKDPSVRSLLVIDVMEPVIKWHQQGLLPLGAEIASDPRTKLIHADFFELASSHSFDQPGGSEYVHAVLLDIDHSPSHWLNSANSSFYTEPSLQSLSDKLVPGGIFGLWSNDPPEAQFTDLLDSVFESSESHIISFHNPYRDSDSTIPFIWHKNPMTHENKDQIDAVKHWLEEIVIGLNFCPFAAKPQRNKLIRYICSRATSSEDLLIDLQEELTLLDQTPVTEIETTLLIVSKMLTDFSDYNQFLDLVDELLVQCKWEGIFQIASFHPDYCFADTEPDSIDNLTNRSPFPVLHIIREDSIENALRNIADADEIYKQNIRTIKNLSSEQIKTLFHYLSSNMA